METVGTGSFRSVAPPSSKATSRWRAKKISGLLYGPEFDPAPKEAVARFGVRRLGQGSPYLSYGEVFAKGAVPKGEGLAAVVGGVPVPVQLDVKATHGDGSARHGVVTVRVPSSAGRFAQGHLLVGKVFEKALGRPSFSSFHNFRVRIEGHLGEDEVSIHDVSIQDVLAGADFWLKGEMVAERAGRAALGALLSLDVDARVDASGVGHLRLTFNNHKTFSPRPRALTYTVTVSDGERPLFTETIPQHYRNSGWTLRLPVGGSVAYEVVHDAAGFIARGALPPLDLTQPIAAGAIGRDNSPIRPGVHGPLTPYMPTSGGRYEIGPVTGWAAAWAISQDEGAKRAMLRAADIGLTIPWHFADDETGQPIDVEALPTFWADERGGGGMKALFAGPTGGWTPDLPHRPGLAYPAYLATGEAVYARALAHEAAFAISGIWPQLRRGEGLLTHAYQLRTTAWGIRTIGNAAWILPDDDPLKAYFSKVLEANLNDLKVRYVDDGRRSDVGETEGYFHWHKEREPLSVKPWQNDFMAMVLAQEARRGHPQALSLVKWMTPYLVGRVMTQGSSVTFAAAPLHRVLREDGVRYHQWRQVQEATRIAVTEPVYLGSADGGYAILRAALAAVGTVQPGNISIDQALSRLRREDGMGKLSDPQNRLGRAWVPQFVMEEGN
ncbi:MAG: hypothetical protein AAF986_03375 [Pseudomonadota bacterium]